MKGVVFTEFLEMVEDRFSLAMVGNIIADAHLASGGAYTAVGTYPHDELVAMVAALSTRSAIAVPDLLKVFGEHLFGRFVRAFPSFFQGVTGTFPFLAGIEEVIHAKVRKVFPDAQLPRFQIEHHDPDRLVLLYQSPLHFEDLAEGLIHGCLKHFGEAVDVQRETVQNGSDRDERFVLTRAA